MCDFTSETVFSFEDRHAGMLIKVWEGPNGFWASGVSVFDANEGEVDSAISPSVPRTAFFDLLRELGDTGVGQFNSTQGELEFRMTHTGDCRIRIRDASMTLDFLVPSKFLPAFFPGARQSVCVDTQV